MNSEYKRNSSETSERKHWLRSALEILKMPSGSAVKEEPEPTWKREVGKTNHAPFYRKDKRRPWIN